MRPRPTSGAAVAVADEPEAETQQLGHLQALAPIWLHARRATASSSPAAAGGTYRGCQDVTPTRTDRRALPNKSRNLGLARFHADADKLKDEQLPTRYVVFRDWVPGPVGDRQLSFTFFPGLVA
ncbi:hypothetical protein GCM10027067_37730 [Pseudactinotalea suaedae]